LSHHQNRTLTQANDTFRCRANKSLPPPWLPAISENKQVRTRFFGLGNHGCFAFALDDFEPEMTRLVFADAPDLRLQQLFRALPPFFRLCRLRRAVEHMHERQICSELLFQPHRTL
jgi:hypothetical protein